MSGRTGPERSSTCDFTFRIWDAANGGQQVEHAVIGQPVERELALSARCNEPGAAHRLQHATEDRERIAVLADQADLDLGVADLDLAHGRRTSPCGSNAPSPHGSNTQRSPSHTRPL